MSNFKERALDIVNHFAKLVPEIEEDASRRSDYIYVEDPTGKDREVEVSYYALCAVLPEIETGVEVSFDQLTEAAFKAEGIDNPSEEYVQAVKEALEESFGIQYKLANTYLTKALKEIEEINKEAGEIILSTWVLHSMLAGARDFYESSRCW